MSMSAKYQSRFRVCCLNNKNAVRKNLFSNNFLFRYRQTDKMISI